MITLKGFIMKREWVIHEAEQYQKMKVFHIDSQIKSINQIYLQQTQLEYDLKSDFE